tara:strand:- start:374 stop:499 length:126 start_codon:yes stop_codon:yes gene_type:complete
MAKWQSAGRLVVSPILAIKAGPICLPRAGNLNTTLEADQRK